MRKRGGSLKRSIKLTTSSLDNKKIEKTQTTNIKIEDVGTVTIDNER